MIGVMVSLLIGLLYASLQLPLDNRENKNSRNVCLSQIRENIFPRKFLLIQYVKNYFNQKSIEVQRWTPLEVILMSFVYKSHGAVCNGRVRGCCHIELGSTGLLCWRYC